MSARKQRRQRVTTKGGEAIWRKFLRQPPQLTSEQVDTMARNFTDKMPKAGVAARLALASLMRSGRQLDQAFGRKVTRTDAEAGAALAATIDSTRKFLLAVADVLETARTRVEFSMISREDMPELLAAARKSEGISEAIN